MLLACAGVKSADALESIDALLQSGAVPDTWAPNGSSVRDSAYLPYHSLPYLCITCRGMAVM